MSDLSKYRDDLAYALFGAIWDLSQTDSWPIAGDDMPAAEKLAADLLASPSVAQIFTDERTRIATAIEALHYDAPAAKTTQATAAKIARQGGAL